MTKDDELLGKKFNMLKVIEIFVVKKNNKNRKYCKCECDCGNIKDIRADSLNKIYSCGCYNEQHNYLKQSIIIGKRYKAFTIIKKVEEKTKIGAPMYLCRCNTCNDETILEGSKILEYKSCGCLRDEAGKENQKKAIIVFKEKYIKDGTNTYLINNEDPLKNNTSGYKNISWDKEKSKWLVQLVHKKKRYFIDRFDDIQNATIARNAAREARKNNRLEEWIEEYRESK